NQARLLTLIGPGGTGKTRLSVQLGGDQLALYPDGVWMIELAPLADPALIPQTIASVLGLREIPERPLIELVTDYLRAKSALIILDNCEHLIDACARIAESLIQACANLKILASSREALGVSGETTYRVPSLSLPQDIRGLSDTNSLLDYESIRLFVDRATAANPNFKLTKENASSVAQICRRLDGIPLALELAAARARVLSVEQIAERLDDRFRLLTGGARTALPRQQTLRALIDWSYDLLSDPEKALFRRLAVFVGGWTLEAAESVCSGEGVESYEVLDLLTQLVDKSLVIAEEQDGAVRYHRLETIRQYAREKLLETNEAVTVRDRHLDYFLEESKLSDKEFVGMWYGGFVHEKTIEGDNVRAALSWAVDNHPIKAMELATTSLTFWTWFLQGQLVEIRDWCELIISRVESLETEEIQSAENFRKWKALLWIRQSQILMNQGDHTGSRSAAKKGMEMAREIVDNRVLAEALGTLGIGALYSGDPEYALKVTQKGIELSESENYKWGIIWTYNTRVHIAKFTGDNKTAQDYRNKQNAILREEGIPVDAAEEKFDLGLEALTNRQIGDAVSHFEDALSVLEKRGDKYRLTNTISGVAHTLRQKGFPAEALPFYKRSIRFWQDWGHRAAVAHQLECFGLIALAQEQSARATKLFSAGDSIREAIDSVRTPAEQKEFEEAKSRLQAEMDNFGKTWEEGRLMTMEQSIEFALEEKSE
ncbi:MAG: AAA family ATPase, partial [Anaerolineales bacterium]|nr:AAA family ATPase [Anaerolineales bacterium]